MHDLQIRRAEAVLYGLGGSPEPALARAVPTMPVRGQPAHGSSGPFRESIARLDVTFASRRLSVAEQTVVREHYVLGVRRYPARVRRPIVVKLLELMEG